MGLIAGEIVYFDEAADPQTTVYNIGDMGFIMAATALVWLMIPGVGFFYSGLLRRKNALSMIYTSLASIAVVSFQVRCGSLCGRTCPDMPAVVLLGLLVGLCRGRQPFHWHP